MNKFHFDILKKSFSYIDIDIVVGIRKHEFKCAKAYYHPI